MSLRWMNLALALRQWRYPREFRIALTPGNAWGRHLDGVLETLLAQVSAEEETAANSAPGAGPGVDVPLMIALGNEWFRLRCNAQVLEESGVDAQELRMIKYGLDKIENTLKKKDVECLDLTGQEYEEGRRDFESAGDPEIDPSARSKRISYCERPAIMVEGKLVQTAKGIVTRPA